MDAGLVSATPITEGPSLLLVPRAPGPLLAVDSALARPRDDLDALIDDVFGEPVRERPGALDIILVVAGTALIVWTLLGASPLTAVVGLVMLVLGLALPTRDALDGIRSRRIASRKAQARSRGMLLDVRHPSTRRLSDAYARLVVAATRPSVVQAHAALAAGYLAVTEVASLLDGDPPQVAAEVEYVDRRREAIERLATTLEAAAERPAMEAASSARQASVMRATLVAEARAELDAVGGLGSLEQLESLTTQLQREPVDGGR
jgi:hypothetical protein